MSPADAVTVGPFAIPLYPTEYELITFVAFSVTTKTFPHGLNSICAGADAPVLNGLVEPEISDKVPS